ncbi:patr class I histocompatibility antigen, B-2 alpha chain isoform X2 [Monodelphis domestica]|uniref:patr class I histocompatibility antigen, B-2 alpha chain isoform X2 n=1 Tax=Monodelphis domestica TaxID=13616 RepID=UPI0024E1C0E8|nr:patr class I histocompatibility antigen, B-2 alpha chain isoform X2 [Monodelphis domestica]
MSRLGGFFWNVRSPLHRSLVPPLSMLSSFVNVGEVLLPFWNENMGEVNAALWKTTKGSHSMRYFSTAMSRLDLREPRFFSVGYVDDQQFVRFDSYSESQRMEPRAAWMDKVDQDYWERETQMSRKAAQSYCVGLENLRSYYNQSETGVHIIQHMYGCEIFPNGSFKSGFEQYAYDGKDYICLNSETYSWTAIDPQAVNSKRKWEERSISEKEKAYLEETCVLWLHKHLENGKELLLRTDPPSVRVSRHSGPDGEVSLRCRAQGFYPAEISLTWLRDGEEQLQDTEFIETRPGGDGTFQKWAAVAMAPGQEDRYSCRVQHEALAQPLSLRWEPEAPSVWVIVGVTAGVLVLLVTAVVAGAVILRRRNSGGKGGAYVPAADKDSSQGSDVSLIATENLLVQS